METANKWKERAKRDRKYRKYYQLRNKVILFIADIKDNLKL